MKIDKVKVYLIEFILLTILSFALFVPNMFTRTTLAIILAIGALITWVTIRKRSTVSVHGKKVTILLIIFAIIYLVAFYVMGLYFGYYKATFGFGTATLKYRIIPTAVIIIASEVIRKVLLAQKVKYSSALTFIIMVLVDMAVYAELYMLTTLEGATEVIGFTLFASIACNLLYNYTVSRYGITGTIIYRLITVLYMFFIPYIPNVFIFFRSVLRMIYPYIIYHVLEYTFATKITSAEVEDKKKNIVTIIILSICAIAMVFLISCNFTYGMLVVGSGSMNGTIDKGDATFYKAYDGKEQINEGQIIIFMKDGVRTIHRVIDVKNVNGEIRYTTKGDANQKEDEGYITNSDIIGISKFKIKFIGYPSLWIQDIFSK